MLTTIREFFERQIAAPQPGNSRHTIELATAALLAEVVRIDGQSGDAERAIALRAINEKLGLSPDEAATLLDLAAQEMRQATDYFQFTSLINRHFTQEQKVRMIELMWQVAYADDRLDDHELHLIRRIADLLHVPHHDFIATKLRAQRAHPR
ncbi:MAG: TerB family tellurite resistance protein [Burkholderiales bacterium]|nr:MAG: TerB family tellurite resistance protein [Burkholderiales bacterium]